MNTTQAQQKALDDDLVAPSDRLEFGKCNMTLKTNIKPNEATFQVVLDALALTPFYRMRSKQSRVINDLRSSNKLHNWYQSNEALDLGSTRCSRLLPSKGSWIEEVVAGIARIKDPEKEGCCFSFIQQDSRYEFLVCINKSYRMFVDWFMTVKLSTSRKIKQVYCLDVQGAADVLYIKSEYDEE
ncbi:hypothetical protein Tco_1476043 [Tanacetum coccineum]